MKTQFALLCALPLLVVVERGAHAVPVDPLPQYYVTEIAGRVITDVPGATVIQVSQNNWKVQLPPGQYWVVGSTSARAYLANPDSPQTISLVDCPPPMPGWDASELYWLSHTPIGITDVPIVSLRMASIYDRGVIAEVGQVAWVLLEDRPDAVPDQSSTLSLLAAALLGTGGLARFRRFSLR